MKFGLKFREMYQKEAGGSIAEEFDNLMAFLQTLYDKILDADGNIKIPVTDNSKGGTGTAPEFLSITLLRELISVTTVVRPVSENRFSNTLANDSYLQVPVVPGNIYNIEFNAWFTATGSVDVKFAYTGPASPVINRARMNNIPNTNTWAVQSPALYTAAGAYPAAVAVQSSLSEDVWCGVQIIYQPSAAGTLYFQWAQNTFSGVNPATIRKGSIVRYSSVPAA